MRLTAPSAGHSAGGQGIPATAFVVQDVQKEYERLKKLGVVFKTTPATMEPITYAVFDDTCGNFIRFDQG